MAAQLVPVPGCGALRLVLATCSAAAGTAAWYE
jgi:hypothetical protein